MENQGTAAAYIYILEWVGDGYDFFYLITFIDHIQNFIEKEEIEKLTD